MNKELSQKLFDRFKFYRPELSSSVSLMCYGFAVGDGWFKIIWDLSEKIDKEIDSHYAGKPSELAKAYLSENYTVNVFQVKEKFGGLRFYIDVDDSKLSKKINPYIREAENLSYKTCEKCGRPGSIRRNGWISVQCDTCVKKEERRKKYAKKVKRLSERPINNKFVKRKARHLKKTRKSSH